MTLWPLRTKLSSDEDERILSGPPWLFNASQIGNFGFGPFIGGMVGSVITGVFADWTIKYCKYLNVCHPSWLQLRSCRARLTFLHRHTKEQWRIRARIPPDLDGTDLCLLCFRHVLLRLHSGKRFSCGSLCFLAGRHDGRRADGNLLVAILRPRRIQEPVK
jgi:hypothetical protein